MKTRIVLIAAACVWLSIVRAPDASAYVVANALWYDTGADTLHGVVYTQKDWWDPTSGWEFNPSCECEYYYESWVTTLARLYHPSGSLQSQGLTSDPFVAGLEIHLGPPPAYGVWTQLGDHYAETAWWDNWGMFLFQDTAYLAGTGQQANAIKCGDERGNIIEEYRAGQVNLNPTCSDFASSGGTAHFTWSELNGGFQDGNPHNPWGIVRQGLKDGLEATRSNYNRGAIRLSSGYRCPHGNANVGGVQQSYHMHGRAGDMYSWDHTWTEQEFNLLRQAALNTGNTIELFNWTTYTDRHLHAAW